MKNKGFTLVELLGALIIIGVLSLILVPVISNVIKEQKEKQYEQQIVNIELAAKNFGSDNLVVLPTVEGEYIYITLGQLKSMGYWENDVINPVSGETISECVRVKITRTGKIYTYEYDANSENSDSCTDVASNIIISEPTTQHIKNGTTSSYLISINNQNSDILNTYSVDKSKITLLGNTDAIYSVIEGNNMVRIVIRGGNIDGEVGLRLESGAIIKDGTEDLIGESGIEANDKVIVDNTKPQISSVSVTACLLSNERTVTIGASDNNIGISGYAITTNTIEPSNFSLSTSQTQSFVSSPLSAGTYYVWIRDNAGNISDPTEVVIDVCE